jgi:hypothetical protein
MEPARERLDRALRSVSWLDPVVPALSAVTAEPYAATGPTCCHDS